MWGNKTVNQPDLIMLHYKHIPKHHTVSHKHIQLSCQLKINLKNNFRILEKNGTT